jgi:hypothetical protein
VADPEQAARGLLDTSVVIELETLDAKLLPKELAVSAITFAELATGHHVAVDLDERARRQERLQRSEATFEPLLSTLLQLTPTVASMPRSPPRDGRREGDARWICWWLQSRWRGSCLSTRAMPMTLPGSRNYYY